MHGQQNIIYIYIISLLQQGAVHSGVSSEVHSPSLESSIGLRKVGAKRGWEIQILTESPVAKSLVYVATVLPQVRVAMLVVGSTTRSARSRAHRHSLRGEWSCNKGTFTLQLEKYSRLSSNKCFTVSSTSPSHFTTGSQSTHLGFGPRISSFLKSTVLSSRDVTSDERRELFLSKVIIFIFTK